MSTLTSPLEDLEVTPFVRRAMNSHLAPLVREPLATWQLRSRNASGGGRSAARHQSFADA